MQTAVTQPAASAITEVGQDRRSFAAFAIGSGVVIGLIANAFFFRGAIGLSFPLFALIMTGAIVLTLRSQRVRVRGRNWLLVLAALVFAVFFAIRADELMTALNLLAVLWLGALALRYLPRRETFDAEPLSAHSFGVVDAGMSATFMPFAEMSYGWGWLRDLRKGGSDKFSAVLRGLLFALPILAVFMLLLASADAVFDDALAQLAGLFNIQLNDSVFYQAAFIAFMSWFACGALAYLMVGHREAVERERRESAKADAVPDGDAAEIAAPDYAASQEPSVEELLATPEISYAAERKAIKSRPIILSMIETGMILGGVNLLFGFFVAIQFAYFFGGSEALRIQGLTYAQYARRGFFELAAVALLTMALILFLDWVTVRQGQREARLFRVLSLVMIALNGVMLVSASQRMWLYEQAFGFTHLRVAVHVFIAWMGMLFLALILAIYRVRANVFSLGVFVTIVGYLLTLNVMNLDAYIAERNIARAADGYELDMGYLWNFSPDAVDPFIALYRTTDDPDLREFAGQWLARKLYFLRNQQDENPSSLLSAHWGRDYALHRLRYGVRVPDVDWNYYPPGSSYWMD